MYVPDGKFASSLTDLSQVSSRESTGHLQIEGESMKVKTRLGLFFFRWSVYLCQIRKVNSVSHRRLAQVGPRQKAMFKLHEMKRAQTYLRIAILEPSSGRGM